MKTGLLWFDNDPKRTLQEKLTRATEGYKKRTGKDANECHINLGDFDRAAEVVILKAAKPDVPLEELFINGIKVKPSRTVLENHLWIGVSDK